MENNNKKTFKKDEFLFKIRQKFQIIYNINSPDDVTLGGANDGGGAFPVSLQDHVILSQWAVGLQQHLQRRLFLLKAMIAA